MSATLYLHDAGFSLAEIPDASGEIHPYRFLPVASEYPDARWAVRLERIDNEATYVVASLPQGRWHCTCPAFRHRRSKDRDRGCKHCVFARGLAHLLRSFYHASASLLQESRRA